MMDGWLDGWMDGWMDGNYLFREGKVIVHFHFCHDICLLSMKKKHKTCSFHFVPNEIRSGNFPPRILKF